MFNQPNEKSSFKHKRAASEPGLGMERGRMQHREPREKETVKIDKRAHKLGESGKHLTEKTKYEEKVGAAYGWESRRGGGH